jgi:5'-methylthioadenosine phosphorylase
MIGVIGGSGLYNLEGLEQVEEVRLETPFGEPSDNYITGVLSGVKMAFLPRHGRGHRLLPSEVNYRANIYGMKQLGVQRIISVAAVGSLREEIVPGHIVIPDQFIDRTKSERAATFFGNGIVAHVGFADPTCPCLSARLYQAARDAGATAHKGGTYICMEGPAFSTRAESNMYRQLGGDIIGMTNLTEAKLAREAELCYGVVALSTDYDCWHEGHDAVTVDQVVATMQKNVATAREIIRNAVKESVLNCSCSCNTALQNAIMTDRNTIPGETIQKLGPIVAKYLS